MINLKRWTVLFSSCFLLLLAGCSNSAEVFNPVMKEELSIIETYKEKIQNLNGKLKDAESKNQLQNQLDSRRDIDALIAKVNESFKKCLEKNNGNRDVPFSQKTASPLFKVNEVKITACRFNSEIMDFQIQLVAFATSQGNKNESLKGELLGTAGNTLNSIEFKMTNDYPEKGKSVLLTAHAEGNRILQNLSKIIFN